LFSAGNSSFTGSSKDGVTLNYVSWSNDEIVINGFGGTYGQGSYAVQNGDPVTIQVWNTGDTATNGPQTAWGGFVTNGPAITGTVADQVASNQALIAPFSDVTISDSNLNQIEGVNVFVSDPANGQLTNLGNGSYDSAAGAYDISRSSAAMTAALDGLVFDPIPDEAESALYLLRRLRRYGVEYFWPVDSDGHDAVADCVEYFFKVAHQRLLALGGSGRYRKNAFGVQWVECL